MSKYLFKPEGLINAIEDVLPESSILEKDSGSWRYFREEDDFKTGENSIDQGASEDFKDFIERVINTLIEEEKGQSWPEVAINWGIYITGKGLEL